MTYPNGKRWAYSITYDEGCAALLDHALAIHREYGVPGHVALVSTQVAMRMKSSLDSCSSLPGQRFRICVMSISIGNTFNGIAIAI